MTHNDPSDISRIGSRFSDVAALRHDQVAVQDASTSMSYEQLNTLSWDLANRLSAAGCGREDRVALYCRRSARVIALQLAVLRSGAAVVPMDPDDPESRVNQILGDCEPDLVVTDESVPWLSSAVTFDALACGQVFPTRRGVSSVTQGGDGSLAYILYTSGSTGKPKGVMISESAIANLAVSPTYIDVDPSDNFAHLASPSFDASLFEVWTPLLNGARLSVISDRPTSMHLRDFIHSLGVTKVFLTAALFHRQVEQAIDTFDPRITVVTGGDIVSPRHVNLLLGRSASRCTVVHGYGPTEGTTFAMAHRVDEPVDPLQPIPLGEPIQGMSVELVDDDGRSICGPGTGELRISGPGVSHGYWNAQDTPSFAVIDGVRTYLTGDFAARTSRGDLLFKGRRDNQVKVNGNRVELEAVRRALLAQRPIADCIVLPQRAYDGPGVTGLVAYYTQVEGTDSSIQELRASLATMLPIYAVPLQYIRLESLPVGATGKVDRLQLEHLATGGRSRTSSTRAPSTEER